MQILLVEDEIRIAEFILRGLRAEGWSVFHVGDGEKACEALRNERYDAVILDQMLPGMSGTEVCLVIRSRKDKTPVLMLSSLSEPKDRVNGLRAGADDYMSKPFDFDELIARIHALVRRTKDDDIVTIHEESVIECCGIRYEPKSLTVTSSGKPVSLTAKERHLLQLFLNNPNRIFSRERILNSIWLVNKDSMTNIVDVYVAKLRKKLGISGGLIETVRGEGYRFCPKQTDSG